MISPDIFEKLKQFENGLREMTVALLTVLKKYFIHRHLTQSTANYVS